MLRKVYLVKHLAAYVLKSVLKGYVHFHALNNSCDVINPDETLVDMWDEFSTLGCVLYSINHKI